MNNGMLCINFSTRAVFESLICLSISTVLIFIFQKIVTVKKTLIWDVELVNMLGFIVGKSEGHTLILLRIMKGMACVTVLDMYCMT